MSKISSFVILIFLSPLIIIIYLIVVLDNGMPGIFKQKRVGADNNIFWIYKFRTMKKNTPNVASDLIKKDLHKFTKIGPFLRKYSIDEIPQLFNIFRGEMNFIGPRPALYNQYNLINMRTERNIHKLKPGVTGWAQINGRDYLDDRDKVELDQYYLENKSFKLNCKIIVLTITKVIKSMDVII